MTESFTLHDRGDRVDVEIGMKTLANGTVAVVSQTGVKAFVADVTLTADTIVYASGDVLTDTAEVANAVSANGGTALIHSLTLLDKDAQGGALDVVFFRSNKSLGTKNEAVSISDADAEDILGVISITGADYVDFVGSKVATITLAGLAVESASASTSIFVALISRDVMTYTANGLILKLGLATD